MKKLLLACMLALGLSTNAQIVVNESFEGTALPAGWTSFSDAALTSSRFVSFGTDAGTPCAGAKAALVNTYGTFSSQQWYLVYSSTSSNATALTYSFKYLAKGWSTSGDINGTFTVDYSVDGGTTWVNLNPTITLSSPNATPIPCTTISGTIPAGTIASAADFKLRLGSSATGAGDFYMGIDDVQLQQVISNPPTCATSPVPADLATGVVKNPVLSWTAPVSPIATSYDVYFGNSSPAPFAATVTGTSYTPVAPLVANTMYYWKVVPKNNAGDATGCTELSFTTGNTFNYCTPVYTFGTTDGDLIANVEIIGTTLSNNSGSTPAGPSFTYYTGQPNYTGTLQAGETYNVSVTVGTFGSQNVAAWIDYNDNGSYESNERIGFTTASIAANGTATFPITLACNPPLGTHRLRIRDVYSTAGSSIDPCATYSWGETEEYDVTITAAAACPAPSMGIASNFTTTGATLAWNKGCTETAWDLYVVTAGTTAPVASTTPTHPNVSTNTGYVVSGLIAVTDYEFYVRAVCGGTSGNSSWAGPYAFTTNTNPPANDDCSAAVVLTVNSDFSCSSVTNATTEGATASTETAPSCSATGTNDDVWFKFTATSTSHKIDLLNTGFVDLAMAVYSGTCGSLVQVACSDPNTFLATGLTVGQVYYVRVWTTSSAFATFATFDICVGTPPPPPANDSCATAIAVPAITTTSTYTNTQDATSATNNAGFVSCNGVAMNDGVWYSFVGDGTTITVTATPTGWDPALAVYSGACGAFTCVDSEDSGFLGDPETISFVSLQGVNYYINIGHYSGITDNPEGPFVISVATNGILGTNEIVKDNKALTISPNPFTDIVYITNIKEVKTVTVVDMNGRVVKTISNPDRYLQLGDLTSGTYILKIDLKNGKTSTVKAIKK